MKTSITHVIYNCRLQLLGPDNKLLSKFDFNDLGLHPVLTVALSAAFVPFSGHLSLESQRQCWRIIRKFSHYINSAGMSEYQYFKRDILDGFGRWLTECELAPSTCQSHFNYIESLLKWLLRNNGELFEEQVIFARKRFERINRINKPSLNDEQQKMILSVCYSKIAETESRLSIGRRLLLGDVRNNNEENLSKLINQLLLIGHGDMPTQKVLSHSGNSLSRRVLSVGGARTISRMLWMTPEALFPYYLAVQIQCSGNPMAILDLRRGCIRKHPLRADLERLIWEKARSNSEQVIDFPIKYGWSAPNILRKLQKWTDLIRYKCDERFKDNVFICHYTSGHRRAGVPCMQMMHVMLNLFIENNELPNFDFRDIRVSGAQSHHRAGNSLEAAKRRLNHTSILTTQLYTPLEDRALSHAKIIREFQGELVKKSMAYGDTAESNLIGISGIENQTVFGFSCKDPFGGIASGSIKGKRCLHFGSCSTCPGALVVLDDVNVIAKILAAKEALENAKKESQRLGWSLRYEKLYAPTLHIIVHDILPSVLPEIIESARVLSNEFTIVELE